MNKIIAYINDNYIELKKDNKYYKIITDSISSGNIINHKLFQEELSKTKLFNTLLTNNITLYLNQEITEKEEFYYKIIFEDLNCTKTILKTTKHKLENNTLIENKPYLIIYNENKYNYINENLLLPYLKLYKIKKLKILSSHKIKENNYCKYYYYNDIDYYFL